jgi:hypothetical protein
MISQKELEILKFILRSKKKHLIIKDFEKIELKFSNSFNYLQKLYYKRIIKKIKIKNNVFYFIEKDKKSSYRDLIKLNKKMGFI